MPVGFTPYKRGLITGIKPFFFNHKKLHPGILIVPRFEEGLPQPSSSSSSSSSSSRSSSSSFSSSPSSSSSSSSSGAASSLLTSLEAYWDLDETSGTRVDATGNGHDASVTGTVGNATGKLGNCATFGSGTNNLEIADHANLSVVGAGFTVACWIKSTSVVAFASLTWWAASKGAGGVNHEFAIGFESVKYANDNARFIVHDQGTGTQKDLTVSLGGSITQDAWYFLVGWVGADNRMHLQINNGTDNQSATTFSGTSGQNTAHAMHIGSFTTASSGNLHVDEVGFWRRVLTSDERTELYNGGSGKTYPFT